MKYIFPLALIVLLITLFCCSDKRAVEIPYPLPLPDSTARVFLPGIVSSDSFDFNACFSADGKSYYFTRNENDRTLIYMIRHDGKEWSTPQRTSFTDTAWSQADPAFAPDGSLYFISNRPKDATDTLRDFDIWFSKPLPNGEWSAPENFKSVNSDSNEYYMSFTATGNVYFGSSRTGSKGQEDIYVSRFENGAYTTPENLGDAINTDKAEFDPFITHDEKLLIFASSNRGDGLGGADLYYARFVNGAWTKAENLGNHVNTATRDFCPYISPDARYFFFSSNRDVKWIKVEALNR